MIISEEREEAFYASLKERIADSISRPFTDGNISLRPRISTGYARYPHDQANMEELIKVADQKMYCEKQQSEKTKQPPAAAGILLNSSCL